MESYDEMLEEGRDELPEDVFDEARFETPTAETRKQGDRTVITNFGDIADTLNREEDHLSKYLLGELGTAGRVEGKELVLQGSFRRGLINSKIEDYTEQYVICDECNRPDTQIRKEKGVSILKCEACGARNSIEEQ
ncbi:MAG: translation initiation factor IF-2 subunit beta [Candidatus Nanohaloarchaea archaeon]|nr:translation initiation factor IF-2 subunit beta [Candidatus Nanohaloarchaea archaeon]